MPEVSALNIELSEIVEVPFKPRGGVRQALDPHRKVTLILRDVFDQTVLQTTWYVSKGDYPDDALLPLTRSWLHFLCQDIADATKDWGLTDDQANSLRRPRGQTLSGDAGSKPSQPHSEVIPS